MNTNKHETVGKAEQQRYGSVLQIGLQYFWFESHVAAADAFALLSKAVHVRKEYVATRGGGPDHKFEPEQLIGELGVTMVDRSALKNTVAHQIASPVPSVDSCKK